MRAPAINRESQDIVELVVRPGEIARLPFGIGDDNLAPGNAADEKTLALRIPAMPSGISFGSLSRKATGESGVRGSSSASSLRMAANSGSFRLHQILSRARNQPKLTPFQAAQERERRLALAKTETSYRLIEN